ncbi:MAG TPA: DUF5723 family protein [Candidatus Kapabacteria bacterium]|nr:DUF5723 family protein [Candidatus Kapabacteria bacterium]
MIFRKISILAAALVLTASLARVLRAQDEIEHLSPFANGAGRTYAITSRGLDAVGLNPSLLALGTPRPFEITLAPISSLGLNAGPSLSQINSISQGLQASGLSSTDTTTNGLTKGDSTRESIANLLSNNNLSSTIDARIFGMSYSNPTFGAVALTWTMHAALRASIPSGLLDYIGVGALARLGQGDSLLPQQPNVQGIWYSEYTLSYARTILGTPGSGEDQLLAGIGVKYLAGIAAIQMDPSSEFFVNYPRSTIARGGEHSVGVNYRVYSAYPNLFNFTHLPSSFSTSLITNATAGTGFGADLGLTWGTYDSTGNSPWQVALSVTDIGSIRWDQNASVRQVDTIIAASNSQGNKDTLNAQLKALGGTLDTTIGSFTTALPTTLHLAGALDLSAIGLSLGSSKLEAAAEFALGLTNTVGSPNHGRFGLAVLFEQPGNFAFHTALGFTTQDGITDLTAALGFGIANRILVDAGTSGLTALFSRTGHTDAVFGLKVLL